MLDVGDLRKFARSIGRWLYGVNPDLDAEKLQSVLQQFATSAPIGVGEILSLEDFCKEATKGYTSVEEASEG